MTDTQQYTTNDPDGTVERAQRARVLKGGHAAFNHEFSAVPCIIRDESDTGAKLQFDDAWWVPDQFILHVEIDAYKVECEKVWHKGNLYGVRFTGEKKPITMGRRQAIDPSGFKKVATDDDAKQNEVPSFGPKKAARPSFGKLGR